ncbi:PEPxxWA-CTERM sorting domain-containing protein [Sandarakinorhabdus sp. DWP1-3-1]|uniref:PEPxxWA-CTERM sorting domain-containing protein n=1 Tax=Sandarakinorhabdus sp. DWP1-3-1 TaxID=2804627 RepID=UPI003CF5CD20
MKKLLFGIAAMLATTSANAAIIPTLVGDPTDAGNGTYLYTYSATLASDAAALSGSFFTLYDIAGFDSVGNLPANFEFSTQLLGLTPANVLPTDDPTLANVTFTYTGPDLNYDEPFSGRDLGLFEIYSTNGAFGFGDFTAETVRNDGPTRGTLLANIGVNAVAIPGDGAGSFIPEPEAWAMIVFGFGLVGAGMRRRARTPVVAG